MQIDFARCSFGKEEKEAVNRVMETYWLASGKENEAFEREFSEYIGTKYAVCCNSGSSANLLALAGLNLPRGSKVLTSACGFPATLSPIIHLGLEPVLVDYDMDTHNIDVSGVIEKCNKEDIKAVIFAHTLGNPVETLHQNLKWKKIKIIEDCCEAVGASLYGSKVGSLGDLGTFSFYPAHQMTALGGGGMVTTNDEECYQRMKSLRDWGKMYDWDSSYGGNNTDYSSPIGYHRGYTYQTTGWNFKLPEANCAFGREQLKKLDEFNLDRRINWQYLYDHLKDIKEIYTTVMSEGSSPFGYCMTVREERNEFGKYLERCGIKHRPFFAGNILRHEPFKNIGNPDEFPVADHLMNNTLFVGCWSGMTKKMLDYMIEVIKDYFKC